MTFLFLKLHFNQNILLSSGGLNLRWIIANSFKILSSINQSRKEVVWVTS